MATRIITGPGEITFLPAGALPYEPSAEELDAAVDRGREKADAERQSIADYRSTHAADGYALGSPQYPDNRQGRRALARTWKRANR